MRSAKILATLGPATKSAKAIEKLVRAGANGVRINMAHGTREEHVKLINNARSVSAKLESPLAILVDIAGPKIRTGVLVDRKPVKLVAGNTFILTTKAKEGNDKRVSTNFKELPNIVRPGTTILLDDASLELMVLKKTKSDVICEVVIGGYLNENKGINLPGVSIPVPSLTEKDIDDLDWALEKDVDYIALSFVRRAKDCKDVKKIIKRKNRRKFGRPLLVAKIEMAEAIKNLDAIIAASDGLMVARGDLGVETGVASVPIYQKEIISKSISNDKFVITATQMLQSMIDSPRPTRAEASDVANAVWEGTDAVMLSAETAVGKYPDQTVATMARIIDSAETLPSSKLRESIKFSQTGSGRTSQGLCKAAGYCAKEIKTDKIAVITESGLMARRLSSFRSGLRTFALTTSDQANNQLALIWGVTPFFHEISKSTEEMLRAGEKTLLFHGAVETGETIVMMAGRLSGLGLSSSVVVWSIGEDVARR